MFFYVPCLIVILFILYLGWLSLKHFLCNRQTMANRHGKVTPNSTGVKEKQN